MATNENEIELQNTKLANLIKDMGKEVHEPTRFSKGAGILFATTGNAGLSLVPGTVLRPYIENWVGRTLITSELVATYGVPALIVLVPSFALAYVPNEEQFRQLQRKKALSPEYKIEYLENDAIQMLYRLLALFSYVAGICAPFATTYIAYFALDALGAPLVAKIIIGIPTFTAGFTYKIDALFKAVINKICFPMDRFFLSKQRKEFRNTLIVNLGREIQQLRNYIENLSDDDWNNLRKNILETIPPPSKSSAKNVELLPQAQPSYWRKAVGFFGRNIPDRLRTKAEYGVAFVATVTAGFSTWTLPSFAEKALTTIPVVSECFPANATMANNGLLMTGVILSMPPWLALMIAGSTVAALHLWRQCTQCKRPSAKAAGEALLGALSTAPFALLSYETLAPEMSTGPIAAILFCIAASWTAVRGVALDNLFKGEIKDDRKLLLNMLDKLYEARDILSVTQLEQLHKALSGIDVAHEKSPIATVADEETPNDETKALIDNKGFSKGMSYGGTK